MCGIAAIFKAPDVDVVDGAITRMIESVAAVPAEVLARLRELIVYKGP